MNCLVEIAKVCQAEGDCRQESRKKHETKSHDDLRFMKHRSRHFDSKPPLNTISETDGISLEHQMLKSSSSPIFPQGNLNLLSPLVHAFE